MHVVVISAFGVIAAALLLLSAATFAATMRIVDHVGRPVDIRCIECPLILPMLIKIGAFASAGIFFGGLAAGLAIRNERRISHGHMAEPVMKEENEIEGPKPQLAKAETGAEQPKPRRSRLLPFLKTKVKDAATD